jgi:hypothetical protein
VNESWNDPGMFHTGYTGGKVDNIRNQHPYISM